MSKLFPYKTLKAVQIGGMRENSCTDRHWDNCCEADFTDSHQVPFMLDKVNWVSSSETYGGCGWSARARSWWRSLVWRLWWWPMSLYGTGSWLSGRHRCPPGSTPRRSGFRALPPERPPTVTGRCCRKPGLLFAPLEEHRDRFKGLVIDRKCYDKLIRKPCNKT